MRRMQIIKIMKSVHDQRGTMSVMILFFFPLFSPALELISALTINLHKVLWAAFICLLLFLLFFAAAQLSFVRLACMKKSEDELVNLVRARRRVV